MKPELKINVMFYKIVWLFETFTLWKTENIQFPKQQVWLIYTILFRSIMIFFFILPQAINFFLMLESGDLEVISEATFIFGSIILQVSKIFTFYIYEDKFRQLIYDFENDSFETRDKEEEIIVKHAYKVGNRLFWFLICSFNSAVILLALFPILDKSEKRMIPISAWYPFDFLKSPMYEVVFLAQEICTTVFATMDCSLDSMTISLLLCITMKTNILLKRVENGYTGFPLKINRNYEDDKRKYLKECAQQHNFIIRYTYFYRVKSVSIAQLQYNLIYTIVIFCLLLT